MFSATFPKKVEALAREVTSEPVRISIGYVGQVYLKFINYSRYHFINNISNSKFNCCNCRNCHFKANTDITQVIEILTDDGLKWDWLITRLASFCVGNVSYINFVRN